MKSSFFCKKFKKQKSFWVKRYKPYYLKKYDKYICLLLLPESIIGVHSTRIFSEIIKVVKIVPILKPGKEVKSSHSYCPISILSCLEKGFEKVILPSLNEYTDTIYYKECNLVLGKTILRCTRLSA